MSSNVLIHCIINHKFDENPTIPEIRSKIMSTLLTNKFLNKQVAMIIDNIVHIVMKKEFLLPDGQKNSEYGQEYNHSTSYRDDDFIKFRRRWNTIKLIIDVSYPKSSICMNCLPCITSNC